MSLSATIADYAIGTESSEIPQEVITAARIAVVDCLACMVAGSVTDVGRIVRATATTGSVGRATVVGTSLTARSSDAALANGAAAHALDFDDVLWTIYGHPSVAILPASLAVAEDRGLSGRAVLDAFALGVEVVSRIGRFVNPLHYEHGWHTTATIGVFGATVAAARLMGLNRDQTKMAIGIAASEVAGVRRNFGSMTKPFHAGNAARAGVLAAELAAAGMTADREALEGRFGWFEVFGARTTPSSAEMKSSLAASWDILDPGIVIKRYGACGCTHCALDAVVELKEAHGFAAEDVVSVDCTSHPLATKVLQHSRPRTGLEGKFSMEHSLAVALIDGLPSLAHYEDSWVRDPRVQALLPRISFTEDPALAETPSAEAVPSKVVIALRDGRTLQSCVMVPIGDPRRPMSTEDRERKFRTCVAGLVAEAPLRAAWQKLEALDGVSSLRDVLALLSVTEPHGSMTAAAALQPVRISVPA